MTVPLILALAAGPCTTTMISTKLNLPASLAADHLVRLQALGAAATRDEVWTLTCSPAEAISKLISGNTPPHRKA